MKKKISNLIVLTVFLCTALLGFSACGTDNNITERLDALEAKFAALEAANVAEIERKVIDKTSIDSDPVIDEVSVSLSPASDSESVSIGMTIRYNVPTFPYHLALCKVTLTYENTDYTYSIPVIAENGNSSGEVSTSYLADFKTTDIDAVTAEWNEVILYKFI